MEEFTDKDNSLQLTDQPVAYTDDNIRHLDDMEHIRVLRVCISADWATARRVTTASMCCSRR